VLRRQGWVTSTRVGRLVSYRLEDHIVHDLLHWIGAAPSGPVEVTVKIRSRHPGVAAWVRCSART